MWLQTLGQLRYAVKRFTDSFHRPAIAERPQHTAERCSRSIGIADALYCSLVASSGPNLVPTTEFEYRSWRLGHAACPSNMPLPPAHRKQQHGRQRPLRIELAGSAHTMPLSMQCLHCQSVISVGRPSQAVDRSLALVSRNRDVSVHNSGLPQTGNGAPGIHRSQRSLFRVLHMSPPFSARNLRRVVAARNEIPSVAGLVLLLRHPASYQGALGPAFCSPFLLLALHIVQDLPNLPAHKAFAKLGVRLVDTRRHSRLRRHKIFVSIFACVCEVAALRQDKLRAAAGQQAADGQGAIPKGMTPTARVMLHGRQRPGRGCGHGTATTKRNKLHTDGHLRPPPAARINSA